MMRVKYKKHCPNCGKKWRGFWKIFHGIQTTNSGSSSNSFLVCPRCNYHFDVVTPIKPDRTPIPFGRGDDDG